MKKVLPKGRLSKASVRAWLQGLSPRRSFLRGHEVLIECAMCEYGLPLRFYELSYGVGNSGPPKFSTPHWIWYEQPQWMRQFIKEVDASRKGEPLSPARVRRILDRIGTSQTRCLSHG